MNVKVDEEQLFNDRTVILGGSSKPIFTSQSQQWKYQNIM